MSSFTVFILFICIIAILFLIINLFLAPHNSYSEKMSVFECGFHSFLQTRSPFSISFFIYGLLYLILDLELVLIYPYALSSYANNVYGLLVVLIFIIILTIGFIFELGKNALHISSRQNNFANKDSRPKKIISLISASNKSKINLPSSRRSYSTNNNKAFFEKVFYNKDAESPFAIVSNFFKLYPTTELAK